MAEYKRNKRDIVRKIEIEERKTEVVSGDRRNGDIDTSDAGNPYLFQGRRWDGAMGLYYYRNRYYSPTTGRFISQDPMGVWYDGLQYGNGYGSFINNPLTYADPLGFDATGSYKGVKYEIDGCKGDKNSGDTKTVLDEMKEAIDQLQSSIDQLVSNLTLTMPGKFAQSNTGQRVGKWFGQGDWITADEVLKQLTGIMNGLRGERIEIECEYCCDDDIAGYVYGGLAYYLFSPEIHLCADGGFNSGTILHEWAHEMIGAEDHGYIEGFKYPGSTPYYESPETRLDDDKKFKEAGISGDTDSLLENADTIEEYIDRSR